VHKLGIENFGDRVKVHSIHSRCIFKKGSQVRRLFPRCDISLILWFKAALDTGPRVRWVHADEGGRGVREKKEVERAGRFLKAVIDRSLLRSLSIEPCGDTRTNGSTAQ